MNLCDVLVHINEALSAEQKNELEEDMRGLSGVVAPRFNPGQDHLMLVAFNSDRVNCAALLGKVHAHGYRAQLIGA
ncbi:MAG: hypothetical protein AUK53_00375 [Betaproteobacteria bacterium CG2_30_59_46]|nr:MAG: hypothetical protein AUK53_00375 [Betaproteobacteria bacterium CG2_30_59_46]